MYKVLFTLIITACLSCTPECDSGIEIFEGAHFKKGQSYTLNFSDGDEEISQYFWAAMSSGRYNKLTRYCAKMDSVKVIFTLDGRDTLFYISPLKTNRLLIGSYFDGGFLVATDQNPDAWIEM